MGWLLFEASCAKVYNEGSLEGHLEYVKNQGGTPDSWGTFSGGLRKAFEEAENSGVWLAVVEEGSYEIFGVVNND